MPRDAEPIRPIRWRGEGTPMSQFYRDRLDLGNHSRYPEPILIRCHRPGIGCVEIKKVTATEEIAESTRPARALRCRGAADPHRTRL
jgi:hypothetical protein